MILIKSRKYEQLTNRRRTFVRTRGPWDTSLTWDTMWAKLWFNHTRMICAKFGWNWRSGSWEYNAVLLFCYHLPLEKGVIIDLNKLKSLHPRTLCAEFGLNFLNFVKYFSLLSYKVWLISVGWYGEEDENVNSKHTDGRTEGQLTLSFRSGELKNHMSFQLMQSLMQLQK